MDFMTGLKRTNYCGELRLADAGKTVTVAGWVQRQRDLGALIFIDLRDREGIVQLAFDESTAKDVFEKAASARSEYVLMAQGVVRERSAKNTEIPTGEIEIEVTDLRILAKSETPPLKSLKIVRHRSLQGSNTAILTFADPICREIFFSATRLQKSQETTSMKTALSK